MKGVGIKVIYKRTAVCWTDYSNEHDWWHYHAIYIKRHNRKLKRKIVAMLRHAPKKWKRGQSVTRRIYKMPEVTCVSW